MWVKEYFVIPVAAREYQNGKRLASINHVYSGPMSQVTVVHYVNARVHPPLPPSLSSLSLSHSPPPIFLSDTLAFVVPHGTSIGS